MITTDKTSYPKSSPVYIVPARMRDQFIECSAINNAITTEND